MAIMHFSQFHVYINIIENIEKRELIMRFQGLSFRKETK